MTSHTGSLHSHTYGIAFAAAIVALTVTAAPGEAQTIGDGTAKALFTQLVINRQFSNPERATALLDQFTKSIVIGISTAPVGASSAGFTYEFDAQTGERTLKSQSFGPLFVERPLTNGKGVFNFGLGVTRAGYSEFEGEDLQDRGILLFDNRVQFRDNNQVQYISEYLAVSPKVTTVNALLGYGVTRSLDVGVVVPFTSMDLTARRYWNYDVARSYAASASDRAFFTPGPVSTGFEPPAIAPNSGQVSATGLGDITVRAKYAFGAQAGQGVAVVADVRLPTGDDDNLLGAGKASSRIGLVGSRQLGGAVSFYANAGYRFGGLTDEGNYAFAVDTALLPSKKLTASLELTGQYLKQAVKDIAEFRFGPITSAETILTNTEPLFVVGGVNIVHGAIGVKYNIATNTLLTGSVLIPIGKRGLSANYTAFVGLDFSIPTR